MCHFGTNIKNGADFDVYPTFFLLFSALTTYASPNSSRVDVYCLVVASVAEHQFAISFFWSVHRNPLFCRPRMILDIVQGCIQRMLEQVRIILVIPDWLIDDLPSHFLISAIKDPLNCAMITFSVLITRPAHVGMYARGVIVRIETMASFA